MAELYEIRFWAHQFYEHCALIEYIFRRNDLLDDFITQQLREMQDKWMDVQQSDVQQDDDLIDLINQTRVMKDLVENIVKEEELPCIPDLILHMKEELNYFESAILNQEWSPVQEMKWWAQEHSENLDFNNCQLPVFIAEESLVSKIVGHPEAVDKMINESADLSALLTKLHMENDEQILYQQLMKLKVRHIDGLSKAIYSVSGLPLSEETKKLLYDSLKHESAEAEFAFKRLQKLKESF